MLKFGICFCLLALFAGVKNNEPISGLDPSSYLYTISSNNGKICTGTAVRDSDQNTLIATAAHCVYRVDIAQLSVSEMTKSENKIIRPIDKVMVHPYYMPPLVDYDVALLRLKKNLPNDLNDVAKFVKLSGKEPKSQSDSLSTVELNSKPGNCYLVKLINARFEDRKSCRPKLAKNVTVSSKMLCADFQSTLVPDGSPLLFDNSIVGIASYGLKGNLPKIFTNIANPEIFSFIDHYL